MAQVTITQVRSTNGSNPRQRATLRSLSLGRIGRSSVREDSPQLQGMLRVVEHLVAIDGQVTKAGVKAGVRLKPDPSGGDS